MQTALSGDCTTCYEAGSFQHCDSLSGTKLEVMGYQSNKSSKIIMRIPAINAGKA